MLSCTVTVAAWSLLPALYLLYALEENKLNDSEQCGSADTG
jgi:hypothetical protein